MKEKFKNFIIGFLFACAVGFGIAYFSADNANASSTTVNYNQVHYEVIHIAGYKVAVFRYNNDIEVIKL